MACLYYAQASIVDLILRLSLGQFGCAPQNLDQGEGQLNVT